jgi:hypothetical protein
MLGWRPLRCHPAKADDTFDSGSLDRQQEGLGQRPLHMARHQPSISRTNETDAARRGIHPDVHC